MRACSIRALWILTEDGNICFSRRFPTVEREWRKRCLDSDSATVHARLPYDEALAAAFLSYRQRERSAGGCRQATTPRGTDAWVDDPILRHIIGLEMASGGPGQARRVPDEGAPFLWPLVVHSKGLFQVLVLPLVEVSHVAAYHSLRWQKDCGGGGHVDRLQRASSLSNILLEAVGITGAFAVAQALAERLRAPGDPDPVSLIMGTTATTATASGIFDSFSSMSMNIAALSRTTTGRTGPITTPNASGLAGSHPTSAVALKIADRDSIRAFIGATMPFGVPLDLSWASFELSRSAFFANGELPPGEQKTPAWKPYLPPSKLRPKISLTIKEVVNAAVYDRESVDDVVAVSGSVECRAELEGLPDVSLQIASPPTTGIDAITFHPCAQAPEDGLAALQTLCFSPPLSPFPLVRYQAAPRTTSEPGTPPPLQGFYQLQMVSENEGAFLLRMKLMEGYKVPASMDACSLSIPFPRRKIIALEGSPSMGSVVAAEHSVEWRIISSGRGLAAGKVQEASFSGTVRFDPHTNGAGAANSTRKDAVSRWEEDMGEGTSSEGDDVEEEEDEDEESSTSEAGWTREEKGRRGTGRGDQGGARGKRGGGAEGDGEGLEEGVGRGGGAWTAASWDDPYCREAYNYAKASFKITGATFTGVSIDTKSVGVYPSMRVAVDVATEVLSGEYVFWNSLGKYASAPLHRQL